MAISRREFVKQSAALGLAIGGGSFICGRPETAEASSVPTPLRPPGALVEKDFIAACIRCLRCVDACPNRALFPIPQGARHGRAGTPTLHMRKAACMLCMSEEGDHLKCTTACPSGALQPVSKNWSDIQEKVRIGVAELDLDLCYSYNNWSCGACYRACPLAGEAMTVGMWERPTVHAEACVGCGMCEDICRTVVRGEPAIRVVRTRKPAGHSETSS